MATSIDKSRLQAEYRNIAKGAKTIVPLTAKQFENLMEKFYEFASGHGFYRTIPETVQNKGFYIFQFQHEIARAILRSIFMQIDTDILISILRQVGKTEFVSLATAFAYEHFYDVFNRPIEIAVIAPEKETAAVVFRRITKYINPNLFASGGDTKRQKESVKGDRIELFGIYDEYKGSTVEGRSFDMILRDEAHLGNDRKFADEVEPTMLSRRGCMVMIGNGGFKKCLFQSYIQDAIDSEKSGKRGEMCLIRYTYTELKPYMQKLAEAGIEACAVRIDKIERYIRRHGGLESKEVLKNIFCKWMLGYQNAITTQQIMRCYDHNIVWDGGPLYMGLDFATMHDRTVATIMDENRQIIDWIVVKEANQQMKAREQGELLREVCDERGYTPALVAIGYDATGVGAGGIAEILEEEFNADVTPYSFSGRAKHDWYVAAIECRRPTSVRPEPSVCQDIRGGVDFARAERTPYAEI
jgi:phage terminase large subunit-like protein